MRVVCSNCRLSFLAPEGASGLVCPICRVPLKPPEASDASWLGPLKKGLDWSGGTLDDLVALVGAPAWSGRIEVIMEGPGISVGEVQIVAGSVSDAVFQGTSTHDALDKLRHLKGTAFRVESRLPNPANGDLTVPGPDQGNLEERPLATLMRYCEEFVLTVSIEVWRVSENARVEYRRGEIVGVTVGGVDAPERLAEVMKWASGKYRLIVPGLLLPEPPPKAPAPTADVADSQGTTRPTDSLATALVEASERDATQHADLLANSRLMRDEAVRLLAISTRKANRVEMAIIVLSCITTGSLAFLCTEKGPAWLASAAKWVGAILALACTILTACRDKITDYTKISQHLVDVITEIERLLGQIQISQEDIASKISAYRQSRASLHRLAAKVKARVAPSVWGIPNLEQAAIAAAAEKARMAKAGKT